MLCLLLHWHVIQAIDSVLISLGLSGHSRRQMVVSRCFGWEGPAAALRSGSCGSPLSATEDVAALEKGSIVTLGDCLSQYSSLAALVGKCSILPE